MAQPTARRYIDVDTAAGAEAEARDEVMEITCVRCAGKVRFTPASLGGAVICPTCSARIPLPRLRSQLHDPAGPSTPALVVALNALGWGALLLAAILIVVAAASAPFGYWTAAFALEQLVKAFPGCLRCVACGLASLATAEALTCLQRTAACAERMAARTGAESGVLPGPPNQP